MGSKPAWAEEIARERIDILFAEADEAFPGHPDRTARYVEIARNIAMAFNISIDREKRERFCSDCYAYIQPGVNARVRVDGGVRKVTCEECGHTDRFPLDEQ